MEETLPLIYNQPNIKEKCSQNDRAKFTIIKDHRRLTRKPQEKSRLAHKIAYRVSHFAQGSTAFLRIMHISGTNQLNSPSLVARCHSLCNILSCPGVAGNLVLLAPNRSSSVANSTKNSAQRIIYNCFHQISVKFLAKQLCRSADLADDGTSYSSVLGT